MALDLWTPEELFALRQDERMNPLPNWILETFFTETYFSSDREIKMADLPEAYRVMAPFVLPTEQGKPIFKRKGERLKALTPPYIKPKDAVRPEDAKNVLPSQIFRNRGQLPSLEERFEQRVVEMTQFQLRAIRMTEIWMAARAFFDAKVTIRYDRDQGAADPEVTIDFGRDPGHTITKTSAYWDNPDTPILDDVESWMTTQYLANGGGSANMLLVGAKVAPVFKKNKQVLAQLDTRYRGNEDVVIKTGIMRTEQPMKRIGQLTDGLEIWTYKDTVEDYQTGAKIDLFNEKDVMLIAPGATGVRAYGAIYDPKAFEGGSVPLDIFGKMWTNEDPGELMIMHQSAPLPIPLYPNRTLKARVLA